MKQIEHAMALIHDAAQEADVRAIPEVTLTFNTRGDRYRFEMTMRRNFNPVTAVTAMEDRPAGEFGIEGVVFRLAVRQVDAP